ncbi:MAG: HupU protein [Magnetospirillum sp. WYHS-4]
MSSHGTPLLTLVWLQAGSCGGCTVSLLGAEPEGPLAALGRFGIDLVWHPSLSEASGPETLRRLDGPCDILVVEGAILRGPKGSGRFHILSGTGRSMASWVADLAGRARWVVAAGSCAAFGGFPASGVNSLDACGLQFEGAVPGGLLGAEFRSPEGLPVVNLPGCAPHPDWMIETLQALALGDLGPGDLDEFGRPAAFYRHLAHHGCPRNEFYEFKASADGPTDLGCLMENRGCRGTQALGDCNIRLRNGQGSCIRGGFACIGCTSPGFQDPGAPFGVTPKVAGIPVGLPVDMPKAWFVALAALSKSATPERLKVNAHADRIVLAPAPARAKPKGGGT